MTDFKVGDKLICIKGGDYVTKGEIVTVKQVDEPDCFLDLFVSTKDTAVGYWVRSKDFELFKGEQNVKKFNIGDIVRAADDAKTRYSITRDGWTGKVTDIRPSCEDDIKLTGCNGYSGTHWVCSNYFELVDEKKNTQKGSTEKVGRFRVGDIVVGNSKANSYGITCEGFKGRVAKVWLNSEDTEFIQIYDVTGEHEGPFDVRAERFDLVSHSCPLSENATESPICPALTIKQVIFNEPATVVIWSDDVKTVVKCGEDEKFDPEKGLAMCVAKRAWGNKYNYFIPFKKYCSKYKPKKVEKPVVEEKPVEKKPTVKKTAKKPVAKNRVVKKTTTKKTTRKTK